MIEVSPVETISLSTCSVAKADRICVPALFIDCCPAVISATETNKTQAFNYFCYLFLINLYYTNLFARHKNYLKKTWAIISETLNKNKRSLIPGIMLIVVSDKTKHGFNS